MRSSEIRAREQSRPPSLARLQPKTREQRIRDEVRGEFQRFGMVDASEVTTRVTEEWETR